MRLRRRFFVMAENKFSVVKLTNRMEMLLIKEGLWNTIKDEKPNPVTSGWTKQDNEARAFISLMVGDNQLNHDRKATSASQAWKSLQDYQEKASLSKKVRLMREICGLKLSENGNTESHIGKMTELFDKLNALGEKLSDSWVVAMLLSSLPNSYDTLITALETRPEADLTISLVQSKLLEEYRKRCNAEPAEQALKSTHTPTASSKPFHDVVCFSCKKRGHMKRDCKARNNRTKQWSQSSKGQANTAVDDNFAFITANSQNASSWIIDSGASCHIAAERHFLSELDSKERGYVTVGNGMKVEPE